MEVVRLFTDQRGETSVETLDIPMDAMTPGARTSALLPALGVVFWQADETQTWDWHPAGSNQWMFVLSGCIEVEIQGGRELSFGPGDVFLACDTTGRGHISRCKGPSLAVRVPLSPELDLSVYRRSSTTRTSPDDAQSPHH